MPAVETPALATPAVTGRGSALPLLLYALTGFTGLLA
jgi:hypothetical protein